MIRHGDKNIVKVDEVDVKRRAAHVIDKHLGRFWVSFRTLATTHQVPDQDELWLIEAIGNQWHFERRLDRPDESPHIEAMNPGDVRIRVPGKLQVNDRPLGTMTWDQFTSNGSTTVFTLANAPVHAKSVQAFNNAGSLIHPDTYTVNDTTITFNAAPASSKLTVYYQR